MPLLRSVGSIQIMTFECLGDLPGPRFLDGRTQDGTVGLAPSTDDAFTGTRWEVTTIGDGVVTMKCRGAVEPADHRRFLDGQTLDGTVDLAPRTTPPFSGARWALVELAQGVVTLQCLGDLPGPRFLDGRTLDGTVGLAPTTAAPFTGTLWEMSERGGVILKSLGEVEG